MKIHTATKVADDVLAQLKKLAGPECHVQPYVNGREHGWTVFPAVTWAWDAPAGVSFAENRNSDDIVVYVGTNPYVGPDAQHVTDEAYRTRTFFKRGEHAKAAKYAAAFLRRGRRRH